MARTQYLYIGKGHSPCYTSVSMAQTLRTKDRAKSHGNGHIGYRSRKILNMHISFMLVDCGYFVVLLCHFY